MFILTGLSINKMSVKDSKAQIFDTSDGKVDVVSLGMLATALPKAKLKIYGITLLNTAQRKPTVQPIPMLGLGIDNIEAKQALATYYINTGMSKEQAYKKVHLR